MAPPAFFQEDHALVELALDEHLPAEATEPSTLHRAMRYSVFAGGKRIRPILALESARLFSPHLEAALRVGCAIEFIHTYSLIHDDLPALDNDALRRGKPTCHVKFGEAHAILAGDGLLTLAFETLARTAMEPARSVRILTEIATAAGTVRGMVGGQVADIEAEKKPVDAARLEYIHRSKTAALIRASIVAGAIAGGAQEQDTQHLWQFGDLIGWAFQVVDDILDVEGNSTALGKTAGKDEAQQKATYPALFGLKRSHEFASELAARALGELAGFGQRAQRLRELADFLVTRRA